ncbi:choice-of-anchor M domain-containing protein [Micromonospora sp. WMMD1082]|uniref:choice-of-anchor M domain-containing protein n=1 Tax=Micromonospora sp. WMMD1082 TaxID=3016104 RepID=UPI00241754D0|nr:choice-of-anchor M domain-containing protein [Micromonospora sp. WMMD1082]MDG4793271.1 choice-of-anchor M domain-containing protein [Micromonospora sp. WMMD1082]
MVLGGQPASPDPALDQSIAPDQPVAGEPAVLRAGHVDLGPRYVDDEWTLLIHDDAAEAVWRDPDRTVLHVTDAAVQTVPEDPAYGFLGVPAGSPVHVVPQIQHPQVVWLGWNTQDPQVMRTIDRGVTLELAGVDGPGEVVMYVQAGTFSEPQVLWRSTEPPGQPMWVEVNTHTHANWVFTAPGVYLLAVRVSADLINGERASVTRHLRFAVGDATSTDEALAARPGAVVDPEPPAAPGEGAGEGDGGSGPWLVAGLVVVAGGLAVALLVVVLRGRSVRRRAERERATGSAA